MAHSPKEHFVANILEDFETNCWGCGLRLLLPSYAPVFRCGWCGAITDQNINKPENKSLWWRRLRDRCFLSLLCLFILFVICGGVWAVFPVVFSVSFTNGVTHCIIVSLLAISTLSTLGLAAFRCAGEPPSINWGTYPAVGKGDLDNFTFCHYCSKPKSPRTHHCRSCGMCILDMDHHCPFIGNCVGADNHRHFIAFLISAIVSTIYACVMSAYASIHIWQPHSPTHINPYSSSRWSLTSTKEVMLAYFSSAIFLSPRGLLLIYLFIASLTVDIGLSILLWQQLYYIYEGKTYLSHLSSKASEADGEKSCQNLLQFFGCPDFICRFFPSVRNYGKKHKK